MLFKKKKKKKNKSKETPRLKKVTLMFLLWLKEAIYFVISQEFQELFFCGGTCSLIKRYVSRTFFLLLQDLPNVPLGKKFLVKLIFAEFIFAFQYPQNSLHCGANLCKFSPVFVHLYFQTATVSTLV